MSDDLSLERVFQILKGHDSAPAVARLAHFFKQHDFGSDQHLTACARTIVEMYGPELEGFLRPGDAQTIYVAPSVTDLGSTCRVYALPHLLREGQAPRDIDAKYQEQWKEIALLANNNERLVYIDPAYSDLAKELPGLMAGTYQIYVSQEARRRRDSAPLLMPNQQLVLSHVKRDERGALLSAYVENGAWNLARQGDQWLAKDGQRVVSQFPVQELDAVLYPYPENLEGHETPMEWAQNRLRAEYIDQQEEKASASHRPRA